MKLSLFKVSCGVLISVMSAGSWAAPIPAGAPLDSDFKNHLVVLPEQEDSKAFTFVVDGSPARRGRGTWQRKSSRGCAPWASTMSSP